MAVFRLTADAKASLMQIARYTQKTWGRKQRVTYLGMMDVCFSSLAVNSMQGRSRPDLHHALRSYPAGKHIVFYIARQDHVVIVNVLHERTDPVKHIQSENS